MEPFGGTKVITRVMIKRNEYRDSVFLMVVNEAVRGLEGIEEVAVMMGTESNKGIIRQVGFLGDAVETATSRDILICIKAGDEQAVAGALAQIDHLLSRKTATGETQGVYKTMDAAVRAMPGSNLAIVSVPGQFAGREARKALKLGLNVLLFSDNVSVDEEIELKRLAYRLNRIVMGPDCGTAIINHVPLAFANVVRPGSVGLLAASGTGLQEVACLIDRAGEGISQAIGTGGRDLSDRVGGLSTLKGMEVLERDEETAVMVLISKPPGSETMERVLGRVARCSKRVIVNFLGADPESIAKSGALVARTLEETASLAVASVRGEECQPGDFRAAENDLERLLKQETRRLAPHQRFIRGLYSGGTLCYEAMLILGDTVGAVYSNIALRPEFRLRDLSRGRGHTLMDLGDDSFTRGRPHPMISAESRNRYIASETNDPEVAVVLLDVVLGYGSHRDMAGALSGSIEAAKGKVEKAGGYLSVVTSVCGTTKDPQDLPSQVRRLEEVGAIVMPSNAQAARFAAMISSRNH
jgi:FdrA protein